MIDNRLMFKTVAIAFLLGLMVNLGGCATSDTGGGDPDGGVTPEETTPAPVPEEPVEGN